MEVHEPYHSLPKRQWKRKATELRRREKETGKAIYAAVPPSEGLKLIDAPTPYRVRRTRK